jgi:hypothetical protein
VTVADGGLELYFEDGKRKAAQAREVPNSPKQGGGANLMARRGGGVNNNTGFAPEDLNDSLDVNGRVALTPGCQVGYMSSYRPSAIGVLTQGCTHSRVADWLHGLIPAVINRIGVLVVTPGCFDCKMT